MTRVGITGHSNLTADSAPLVADALRAKLAAHVIPVGAGPVKSISCGCDLPFFFSGRFWAHRVEASGSGIGRWADRVAAGGP